MTNPPESEKPEPTGSESSSQAVAKARKAQRLASALRDNLRRRKAASGAQNPSGN